MKTLLFAKAAVEVLAGLALALFPVLVVPLLLGSPLDAPVGEFIGRLAGVALLALGIACWLARKESQGRAAAGLIVALLFYDAAVVVILLFARLGVGQSGIGLWPAVALHSGLGVWSVLCLRKATQLAVER
jgi:riboflavin transporter FmnP